jgi:hypothetical protein
LSTASATADCVSGSSWDGSKCIAILTTGTLTSATNSCIINSGNSTCPISFSWTTTNPVGVSAITKDGVAGNYKIGNSGSNVPFIIPFGITTTFRLYNNSVELANKTVTSSCMSGSTWNGSFCYVAPPTNVTLIADPTSVEYRKPSTLTWSSSGADRCVGINFSTSDEVLGSVVVNPKATTIYTVTCYNGLTPAPNVSATVTVGKVKPIYKEQ